jgi:hypothetical protein
MSEEENVEKIPSNEKPKSYVVEGATLKCSCGDKECKLKTPGRKSVLIQGKLQANIMDFIPKVNIDSFGKCKSLKNPLVAAATSANHGRLKPMPCIPNVTIPWINGKEDMLADEAPALLDCSKNMCIWGGKISIVKDGQSEVNWGRVGEGATKIANGGLLCWIGVGALMAAVVAIAVLTAPVSASVMLVAGATAAAGVLGGATCTVTGVLDINEGKQDIDHGMRGSDEESHNPLKEAVGAEAYYNAEMIATGVSLCAMSTVPYLAPFAGTAGPGVAGSEVATNRKLASKEAASKKNITTGKAPSSSTSGKNVTSALKLKSGEIDTVGDFKRTSNMRSKPTTLTIEQINNRINLRGATHDELARLKASGIGKKQLGPAVAGVYDTKTGKYYYGTNQPDGFLPEKMHELIKNRIKNMPQNIKDCYAKTKGVGSHAEVNALNEALLARPDASLDDFMVHVISTKPLGTNIPTAGFPMPRCPHCEYITNGVKYIPEVLKYGE